MAGDFSFERGRGILYVKLAGQKLPNKYRSNRRPLENRNPSRENEENEKKQTE